MTFAEKIFKLRKEKGFSQEALAEKLNTTRQAISKWENGQGFPETEKLLMIGNIFEVSIDYLLKDTVEQSNENEDGYYVSKEMAEGYLLQERKISKNVALGFSLLILCFVPYLILKQSPMMYTLFIIIIATIGIVSIVSAISTEEYSYKILKKEALIFDQNYLKELTVRYANIKKRNAPVMIAGICPLLVGGLAFFLEEKNIASGILVPYYPVCAVLIAIGLYIFIRTIAIIEAYKLLVENGAHVNRLGFKIGKKIRKKMDQF